MSNQARSLSNCRLRSRSVSDVGQPDQVEAGGDLHREAGERHAARLLGLLHQDAGHVRDAARREIRRQLEHDLDRVARRQALVGVAAQRPGHGELALRHFDVGADRELGRLPRPGRHGLGPPDRRADEALAVRIGRILLVEHDFLRHRGRRWTGRAGRAWSRLPGSIRSCVFFGVAGAGRHRVRPRSRGRAERAIERHHVRPLPQQDAADADDDDGCDQAFDQVAVRAARPRVVVRLLDLARPRPAGGGPRRAFARNRARLVDGERGFEHRLREILVRTRLVRRLEHAFLRRLGSPGGVEAGRIRARDCGAGGGTAA